jgi:hypothetical protein
LAGRTHELSDRCTGAHDMTAPRARRVCGVRSPQDQRLRAPEAQEPRIMPYYGAGIAAGVTPVTSQNQRHPPMVAPRAWAPAGSGCTWGWCWAWKGTTSRPGPRRLAQERGSGGFVCVLPSY